jgi:hypothetical protein
MAIVGAQEGQIIYQMDKLGKYLSFPIYMTETQRKDLLERLKQKALELQIAIEEQDPSLVGGIYNDEEMKWLCAKCQYLDKCKKIRRDTKEEELNPHTKGTMVKPLEFTMRFGSS